MATILVTGGTGFIACHTILQLAKSHRMRTTIRSLTRAADVRGMLKQGGAEPSGRLSFFAADLENDAGWPEAGSLGPDFSTSVLLVQRFMTGAVPGSPSLSFGVVDVRDIADLHIRAMTHPAAKGERFLGAAGNFMLILDIAKVLKSKMGEAGKKVPTRQLPNWLVRIAALRDPAVKQILPELGKLKSGSNEKAKRLLGWEPRSNEEDIVATAESLLRLGLL
jgi:nucleoside-diphosphate-sugar epimerase